MLDRALPSAFCEQSHGANWIKRMIRNEIFVEQPGLLFTDGTKNTEHKMLLNIFDGRFLKDDVYADWYCLPLPLSVPK